MPTYEYACTACGHRLEAVQKFTDDALTECPECGGAAQGLRSAGHRPQGKWLLQDGHPGAGQAVQLREVGGSNGSDSSGSDIETTKTDSGTKSSDSGSKAEPSTSGSGGDKPAKESKPAASTAT